MEVADIKDIQIVYNLAKELENYSQKLELNLSQLTKQHNQMSNYFKGKQFDDLTNVINNVSDKIKKSADDLMQFAKETKEEAIALSQIKDISIDK
ncbi:MAG: hypothetical protein K5765_08330 [Clostridia bacterium]|nr:hypothetical protein [Clostridia bacterium]